ncbi:MAG: hypothetical protein J2P37_30415 [Ktedonobacteraceae bacterium]|nr:hypothetical protein [Ktedonobacteraceae bacterium]
MITRPDYYLYGRTGGLAPLALTETGVQGPRPCRGYLLSDCLSTQC